jgi:hypothetical protein
MESQTGITEVPCTSPCYAPFQMACYTRDYADWYTDQHHSGRISATVGELKAILNELPDDMPVKVSHQYDRHPVGIQDPIWGAREIAVTVGITDRGAPIMGRPDGGLTYFVVE